MKFLENILSFFKDIFRRIKNFFIPDKIIVAELKREKVSLNIENMDDFLEKTLKSIGLPFWEKDKEGMECKRSKYSPEEIQRIKNSSLDNNIKQIVIGWFEQKNHNMFEKGIADDSQTNLPLVQKEFETLRNNNSKITGDKRLCIYAVSEAYDFNGFFLSEQGLRRAKYAISVFQEHNYLVVPITFATQESLESQLKQYSDHYKRDVSLLVLNGHGALLAFSPLRRGEELKNLSKTTQVYFNACYVGKKNPYTGSPGFAEQFAQANKCDVFATEGQVRVVSIPVFGPNNKIVGMNFDEIAHSDETQACWRYFYEEKRESDKERLQSQNL